MQSQDSTKHVQLSNGETYAYREAGSSSTTLLIFHGAVNSARIFSKFLPQLSETLRVIAVDFRGHGQSSYKTPLSSLDDLVEDIKQFIEVLGIKRFFVMGWSMGGGIAMQLAAQWPDRAQGIILHNSVGTQGFAINKVDEQGNLTSERAQTMEEVHKHPYPVVLMNTVAKQDRETVREYLKEACFTGNDKLAPERLEVYVDEWLRCRCGDCLPYHVNRFNISNEHSGAAQGTNEISKIQCKMLIIRGENDICIPEKDTNYRKNSLGSLAKLVTLENSGHVCIEDCPEEVIRLIKEFCY